MFFRLTNSPATFQTMMNLIFSEEVAECWMTIYMDDMAIHTKRREGKSELQHILHHRSYVCRVLAKLMKHNVTGLGAACRAGAHVSCATGQESVV
jgi:hypothetical protein